MGSVDLFQSMNFKMWTSFLKTNVTGLYEHFFCYECSHVYLDKRILKSEIELFI